MKNIIKYLDIIIHWSIVLLPFSISIASAPLNVFMGLLIVSFLAKKILKREKLFARSSSAINLPLLFLFAITCISVFNSVNFKDSFKGGILRLLQYIFVFSALVEELKDRRHIKKIIVSICCGLILASIDGIWQVFTGRDFIRGYPSVINIGLVRATAAFKDSNTLGIYLSAMAPIIFGLALYYFKNRAKIVFIFLSLLAIAGIMLTYSRPTLLAIYIALFFFGIARKDKIIISFLVISTFISPFIIPKSVKNWAREVEYNPLRFMCNDDRIAAYRNSLNMIRAHPFIGVGTNTYMKNYKKYKEFPEYRNVVTIDYMYAHNMYLQMAAEIGLLGLAIFIWLLCKLFHEARIIYRTLNDGYVKVIALSLLGCLIAFLVNGLTESSLFYSRLAILFWYLSGFILSLKNFV